MLVHYVCMLCEAFRVREGIQGVLGVGSLTDFELRLHGIINRVLEQADKPPVQTLSPESRLQEDLGLDSLELAELTVLIEAEFAVDVFADGVVRTVGDVVEKVGG